MRYFTTYGWQTNSNSRAVLVSYETINVFLAHKSNGKLKQKYTYIKIRIWVDAPTVYSFSTKPADWKVSHWNWFWF